jgi:hypothetical protein
MREYELLAGQSEFCVAVLGNGPDYMLIPLDESYTYSRTDRLCEDGVRRG